MSKNTRKDKIVLIRRVAGIALLLVLVIGVALRVNQIRISNDRVAKYEQLQSLNPNKASARAEAETEPTEAPVEDEATAETDPTEAAEPETTEEADEKASACVQAFPAQPVTILTAAAAPNTETNSSDERVFQDDFEELYKINPDLVGWIDVGNYMSMPVVYKDNSFYLDHDYYGNPDNAGTLFINEANTIWPDGDTPADQNLLFHGHNMRDGSIFGDLDDYRNVDYMQKNVIVYFRTIYDYDPIPYVIFAAFDMSATPGEAGYFDVGYINFDDDAEFEEYTSSVIRRSFFNMPYGVARNDRMLTLLTCSYSNENGRYVLFCRALHEDETVESILARANEITKK